jgi:hypothetical protein
MKKNKYSCPHCPRTFATPQGRAAHIRLGHPKQHKLWGTADPPPPAEEPPPAGREGEIADAIATLEPANGAPAEVPASLAKIMAGGTGGIETVTVGQIPVFTTQPIVTAAEVADLSELGPRGLVLMALEKARSEHAELVAKIPALEQELAELHKRAERRAAEGAAAQRALEEMERAALEYRGEGEPAAGAPELPKVMSVGSTEVHHAGK